MKIKISSSSTILFLLRSEAIAYALTNEVDYKPYNVFETSRLLCECNEDEDENEELNVNDYEVFDVLNHFTLDNVALVQVNYNGYLLWTHDFEEVV